MWFVPQSHILAAVPHLMQSEQSCKYSEPAERYEALSDRTIAN